MAEADPSTSGSDQSRRPLSGPEWRILRACSRLGRPALTKAIVEEVQRESLLDYRYVQVTLARLCERGCLEVEKVSARRSLWSLARPFEELLGEEVRRFVERSVGPRGEWVHVFHQVLAEVEAQGLGGGGLSEGLRERLLEVVGWVMERKEWRDALVSQLGVSLREHEPLSSQVILLFKAVGGDTREGAIRVLEGVLGLGERLEEGIRERLEELKAEVVGLE